MIRTFTSLLSILFVLPFLVNAQCTSSSGVSIISNNFGAGANPGSALAAGITTMTYSSSNCPGDGLYTILNKSASCWPGGDWDSVYDHTGNTNGYFMLVNADVSPSEFYVQTVGGLCDGTSYSFSAWIININNRVGYIKPNITITVETLAGIILQTYNTGDIAHTTPATWQQCNMNFTTPTGTTSVKIKMKNNAAGGNGNDFGLDDISLKPVGPGINITTPGFPGNPVKVCGMQSVPFFATVDSCYTATSYQWQKSLDNGVTWTDITGAIGVTYMFSNTDTGTYQYRLIVAKSGNIGNTNCRVISAVKTVICYPAASPVIQVAGNILSTTLPYVSYQWFRNNVLIPGATSSTYNVTISGNYTVLVSTANCEGLSLKVTITEPNNVTLVSNNGISFSVYPNPAHGNVNVSISNLQKDEIVLVDLIDIVGRKIDALYKGKAGLIPQTLKLPTIAQGLYFVRFNTANEHAMKPIQIIQ